MLITINILLGSPSCYYTNCL